MFPPLCRIPDSLTWRALALIICCLLCGRISTSAQVFPLTTGTPDANFAQLDFAQIYLDQQNKSAKEREKRELENKELIASGVVSALDLQAPNNAIDQFNRATTLMKAQKSREAIPVLQKATAEYPKFVLAHISLGLAYLDQNDAKQARTEFETAANLDDKFPGSFVHLGRLALSQQDFVSAQADLEKAASLRPQNASILSALAYAQNGNKQFMGALETVHRVHALDHKGMANVHYVGASAALALNDLNTMERELKTFLDEDPTNAFAPAARKNLAVLAHNRELALTAANISGPNQPNQLTTISGSQHLQSLPNTDRLKEQLTSLGSDSDSQTCDACGGLAKANANANADFGPAGGNSQLASNLSPNLPIPPAGAWTIRKNVEQVALFFSVSSHGRMVNDLSVSDILVLDDNKPPDRIVVFAPQSKLPLRLALLVDISGSVEGRFSFEKHAAAKFVQRVLSSDTDLGFIAGFSTEPVVTQDFTANQSELAAGIEKLTNGGGTALFDAVSFACWKLAAYPDDDRVARVLVVLSDGEDNSSHSTLKQAIQAAEKTGVTVYAISTKEKNGDKTDADKVLQELAERSGGEALFPYDVQSLGSSFEKLRDLIRSRYFIAYKPSDLQPDGSYHTIRIIAAKNNQRFLVRSRKGYHARLEAIPR